MISAFTHISKCTRCVLRESAIQVVVGEGRTDSQFMIVGEAPGRNEDETGKPFVGKTGVYLFDKLRSVGLDRSLFYITNIVKCRPPNNADPEPNQIKACSGHLNYQIKTIQPKLIIPVGGFALNHFYKGKISEVHGTLVTTKKYMLFPLYHPSYALRKRKIVEPVFLSDIDKLKGEIVRLVNEEKNSRSALFSTRRM